jgi:hypothetical protein
MRSWWVWRTDGCGKSVSCISAVLQSYGCVPHTACSAALTWHTGRCMYKQGCQACNLCVNEPFHFSAWGRVFVRVTCRWFTRTAEGTFGRLPVPQWWGSVNGCSWMDANATISTGTEVWNSCQGWTNYSMLPEDCARKYSSLEQMRYI